MEGSKVTFLTNCAFPLSVENIVLLKFDKAILKK